MHREFLKLLKKATGVSEHVIAINLDIRGFTPFCQSVQPLDVATYVRKVYLRIINDYFKTASYYKPTGDGLIIIIPYTDETLKEAANSTMDSCLALLENFGSLLVGDHMINFPTPQKIGIGLTRGSACCITSDNKTLDYSGRILNLASRLMDLARPSGIVFDSNFGFDLLGEEMKKMFLEDTVYVRGIAEEKSITVYYTKKYTLIPDVYKQPIREPKWESISHEISVKDFKFFDVFQLPLKHKPLNKERIAIKIEFEEIEGYTSFYNYDIKDEEIDCEERGKRDFITFRAKPIAEFLELHGAKEDTEITITADYPVK